MKPHSALYQSIHSQPEVIASLLDRSAAPAREAAGMLASASRAFLSGTGSNSHAAVVGEHLLRSAGLEAYATTSFDFVTYPRPLRAGDVVFVLSHTGTTQYGQRAIAQAHGAGARSIGITAEGSPMPDVGLRIEAGPKERSDTYTESYTATLTALAMMAVAAGKRLGRDMNALRESVERLPGIVAGILAREGDLWPEAMALSQRGRLILAGAGPNAVTAREGALKVKESSFLVAEGFELETMLHGGLQAVEPSDPAVVIAPDGPALSRTRDAIRALSTIGARTLAIADERVIASLPDVPGLRVFPYPAVPEPLSPLPATIPLQLLAAFTAQLRGTNPDNFRFDEAAYKEAIEGLTL